MLFDRDDRTKKVDTALEMLYDMKPKAVEKYLIIPYIKGLIEDCESKDGIWTFLDRLYDDYEMADGDAMDKTRELFEGLKPGSKISVFIGPEGGFDDSEIEKAKAAGMQIITLGKRILRTETAGLTVMSWIMLMTDGKNGNIS